MAKEKFTPETRSFLKEAYLEAVEDFDAPITKEFNDQFYIAMRKTEALALFSDAQMRGSLQIQSVYIATSPRVEPKKKGKCKADLVKELHEFLTVEGIEPTTQPMEMRALYA